MSGAVKHRTVTPFIKFIQDLGRGRDIVLAHRYIDEQASRTQPPPDIPGGPNHKTYQVYYFARDGRREVQPPMLLSGSKQIATESKPPIEHKTEHQYCTPGKVHNWDG